jgi:glycine reductase
VKVSWELEKIRVRALAFGAATQIREGVLSIDAAALREVVRAAAPDLLRLELQLVEPGEATRLVCVKDVVEPRRKLAGASPGQARVRALEGMAVATCGRIVGFQEGIIDMSGPGAAHTPFSALSLLVLEADVAPGCEPHRHEAALREAGLAAAGYLARAVDTIPDRIERLDLGPAAPQLPRVAYVYMLLCQGLLHDTWVEGRNARDAELPRRVDPRLALEGGIVSGNCVSACDKNTTWHHQNNAVIHALLRSHARELAFAGCVLTPAPTRLGDKERAARRAVELVQQLGAQGAVISKEGFGNPDADLMMLIRGLERAGIRTVAISDEFAGQGGEAQSLADTTPEADAIVSVGNANACITLPSMPRTIGPLDDVSRLAGARPASLHAGGAIEVELQAILGATNPLGHGCLTARQV